MLSALHADGWKDVGRSDQLESAFSFLLVCREDLLKHPPSQPTNLALVIPSPPDPPHGLLDLLNGPLQTCGLLQWNGATLVQRRPGELLSPPTQPPPINPDVAGRIQGGVVDLPPGPRAEEIDALLGRHEPDKERANVPPPKPRRPKPVALALTRDARRRAEAEGIAMARGTECLDAANAFDALWTIAAARTQGRRIALIMLGEELGEEGHRLSAAADMLEPGIDIHWLGKAPPKSSQSSPGCRRHPQRSRSKSQPRHRKPKTNRFLRLTCWRKREQSWRPSPPKIRLMVRPPQNQPPRRQSRQRHDLQRKCHLHLHLHLHHHLHLHRHRHRLLTLAREGTNHPETQPIWTCSALREKDPTFCFPWRCRPLPRQLVASLRSSTVIPGRFGLDCPEDPSWGGCPHFQPLPVHRPKLGENGWPIGSTTPNGSPKPGGTPSPTRSPSRSTDEVSNTTFVK